MKLSGTIVENNGQAAVVYVADGDYTRTFERVEGSAEEFLAAFSESITVALKEEWLTYSMTDFNTAMNVLRKLLSGGGHNQQHQTQITVPVPSALFDRLNDWNAKRLSTATKLYRLPRSLRYDFLRSEGIPAAVAKGLRDKPAHVEAMPLQGNKGAEVQITKNGIRVPVLDRQTIIPVEWPGPVATIPRISFAKQEDGTWCVAIYWTSRVENVTSTPAAEQTEAAVEAA